MKMFADKVVVVTGGTSGIGLAAAKAFAAEGARVVVSGSRPASIDAARDELSGVAEVVPVDVRKGSQISALFEHVRQSAGRLDALFVNAGVVKGSSLETMEESVFDDVMNVNVRGSWLTMKHAIPLMTAGSAVVVNTSVANRFGLAGSGAYAASKAALRSLVQTAAAELVERKVRVNAVSPGPTDTPILAKQDLPRDVIAAFLTALVPQKRLASPSEIANAVLFLASSQASYITGVELAVDGGVTNLL